MKARPGDHALPIGLGLSVLLHVLLAALNPAIFPSNGRFASALPAMSERIRLAAVVIETAEYAQGNRIESRPAPPSAAVPPTADTAREDTRAPSLTAERTSAEVTVAERLRYRNALLWVPPAPVPESREERVQREFAERFAELLKSAPEARPAPRRKFCVCARIPFGPKPRPPAQVVPAPPLPDSLRTKSLKRVREDKRRRAMVHPDLLRWYTPPPALRRSKIAQIPRDTTFHRHH